MNVAFGSATAAISTAIQIQKRHDLPVRIGVATGDVETNNGNYVGPVLNRAAAIMAAGHSGQILVAATTALMVNNIDLMDLGNHQLSDLQEPIDIFQVHADGLRSMFPPLTTKTQNLRNLPATTLELHGHTTEEVTVGHAACFPQLSTRFSTVPHFFHRADFF